MTAAETDRFDAVATARPGVLAVRAASARQFGRHTHDQFGVGLVLDGAQDSASGRGEVRAERGEIITVNPNEVHDGRPIGGAPRVWSMLYFDPEALAASFARLGAPAGSEIAHPVLSDARAAAAFRALSHALHDRSAPDDLAIETHLLALIAPLLGRPPARRLIQADAVQRARQRIDDDPAAATSLDELAALSGISPFALIRAFRAATGLPPHAYRLQRRLQLARGMIAGGGRLADVAAAAGFADQAHLTRHFVRAYGLSPGRLAGVSREG
ncbi:AraC family transcriptional regulator [Pleomorphomonas diazotrophica]|uniref:AraC family transcriptional regulator n=1 Tax=Pleomorphomonas diazotrophica TaxID=1166257 RepID=A0A1I4UNX9_9HYPH|nr:AraC family transcriptional regulator [Pleomorphomonas diazotrophica]PKR88327.1 AraC family transcriptional regulator [Pleomorphomonas diazotrophica]SFM90676.1 AraC-type DNA-binding protein [Pleomorphomonas diazotrophica]